LTLGIYIHIPFCVKKCPYCDFTSFTPETLPEDQYIKALIREIEVRRKAEVEVEEEVKVETVYFGGGTPSLLSPNSVKNLLIAISKEFTLKDPEITIEVNPGTVDLNKLKGYRDAGVNRLSLGIQSLNDRLLSVLERIHNRKEALNAYESARKAGFQNIGIDLIHSVPGESLPDWEGDLKEAISLRPEHISAYNLTVEEETHFFHQQEKGLLALPKEEEQVAMFLETERILENAGYEHYEVSNYAIPGFRSRHNQIYWKGGEYLGLGLSAHSYRGLSPFTDEEQRSRRIGTVPGLDWGIRTANSSNLEEYFRLINEKGNAVIEEEVLTKEKAMGEAVFLGLRMLEGIDLTEFEKRFGVTIEATYPDAVIELTEKGLLEITQGHLRLTKQGLLLLNDVSLRFV